MRDHPHWLMVPTAGCPHEILHEKRNILRTIPQGRQIQRQHRQAVVEVLAKQVRFHEFRQVFVRGRDDADVDLDRMSASDSFDFPFLSTRNSLA